jgi:hypothetical protein
MLNARRRQAGTTGRLIRQYGIRIVYGALAFGLGLAIVDLLFFQTGDTQARLSALYSQTPWWLFEAFLLMVVVVIVGSVTSLLRRFYGDRITFPPRLVQHFLPLRASGLLRELFNLAPRGMPWLPGLIVYLWLQRRPIALTSRDMNERIDWRVKGGRIGRRIPLVRFDGRESSGRIQAVSLMSYPPLVQACLVVGITSDMEIASDSSSAVIMSLLSRDFWRRGPVS